MKSAYEIAMEKMRAASGPDRKLTADQRKRIADIESRYNAKAAEARMDFDRRAAAASPAQQAAVQQDRAAELARLESKREAEKEAVWNEAAD